MTTAKRDKQITIRVSEADLNLMKKAGDAAWPGAILSTASVMLSFARMKAEEILARKKKP